MAFEALEKYALLVYKVIRFIPLANFLELPGVRVAVGYERDTGLPIGFSFSEMLGWSTRY